MRPRERRDSGQNDLFRARLNQIVDMDHALARLGRAIDWGFLEARCGSVYTDAPGHPPLPTRLMAGLAILKSMHDLSDEALCDRWVENHVEAGQAGCICPAGEKHILVPLSNASVPAMMFFHPAMSRTAHGYAAS